MDQRRMGHALQQLGGILTELGAALLAEPQQPTPAPTPVKSVKRTRRTRVWRSVPSNDQACDLDVVNAMNAARRHGIRLREK